jgi:hypothetical protein
VFRILVTGGPPNFGGGGIPQRIMGAMIAAWFVVIEYKLHID